MTKSALITGSARRIGKALSLHLAEKGYNIALHVNKSVKEANSLKEKITSHGVKCEIFKGDLTDKNFLNSLFGSLKEKFKNIEILINNASIFNEGKLSETNFSLFEQNFDLHVKAPFFLMKDFAKQTRKGLIINMLDTRVSKNKTRFFAYTLSKKTLMELTKMAAYEFIDKIRVNAIAPGFILPSEKNSKNNYDSKCIEKLMKKKGNIKDILNSLDFFLENDYITGQILYVDGGENL